MQNIVEGNFHDWELMVDIHVFLRFLDSKRNLTKTFFADNGRQQQLQGKTFFGEIGEIFKSIKS